MRSYHYDLRPPATGKSPIDDEQPIEEGTTAHLVDLLSTTATLFRAYARPLRSSTTNHEDELNCALFQVEAVYFGGNEQEITFPGGHQLFLTPAEEPATPGKED